ncbi:MAG: transketolase C-terminal domain-containing protein [Opitutaceae bacterium]|nr:transketolase C-terminal domain-containing protein [Opitutaceae bacterium]
MKKIRQEFADTMLELGSVDPRLVVMVGDISHGILQPYAKACPGRYYNIGICEPTIVNMAAGLSKVGLIPVVHTIAPFIAERAYEQIKLDFGYQKLSGNFITVGGAFDYAQLGCSHHCYADVSLLSHFRRAQIIVPGTAREFNVLFKQIYSADAINYVRIPEYSHGIEFSDELLRFGRGIQVREGKDVTLAVIGTQLANAVKAAATLADAGISAEILYFHTLKPFDRALLRKSVEKTGRLLSIEELSAHDGLFNLCLRSCVGLPGFSAAQIAIPDFIHSYGSYEELCTQAGFSPENIVAESVRLVESSSLCIQA